MDKFELIILGGGPAGYVGAERAASAGLKTLLIEKEALGGVCLNEGCIPTKAMLYSAKLLDGARHGEKYGIKAEGLSLDHAAVLARKDRLVRMLVSSVQASVKAAGAQIVKAKGKIEGRTAEGFMVSAGEEKYLAERLLIATGALPVIPPIPGLKDALGSGFALTNNEILMLQTVPKRLAVIGGGIVGLEMASYYRSAGSEVIVIEMLDRIAGNTDREISGILQRNYAKKGVAFELSAKVIEIGNGFITFEKDGQTKSVEADKVLLSVGRRPNVEGVGLENIGLQVEHGAIVCTEDGSTNVQNVYAAGDVNGRSMLAHTASREAEVCVNNMLGKKDRVNYGSIPSVIYTNPEVASVGETEESASAKGMDISVSSVSMRFSGRYMAENEGGDGICKVVAERSSDRIIGVHMIANYASEIILSAVTFIEEQLCIDDVKSLVFPHPTVCEAIREAVFKF